MPVKKTCNIDDCVKLCDKAFEDQDINAVVDLPKGINITLGRMIYCVPIPVKKRDCNKRGRLPELLSKFCPLCGKPIKYEETAKTKNRSGNSRSKTNSSTRRTKAT